MDKLESGIQGQANIIFGGKIGSTLTKLNTDEFNVVLRVGELKEVQTIGLAEKDREYEDGYQVHMIFNKVESIDAVMKWLELAKEKLQNQIEGKGMVINEN